MSGGLTVGNEGGKCKALDAPLFKRLPWPSVVWQLSMLAPAEQFAPLKPWAAVTQTAV